MPEVACSCVECWEYCSGCGDDGIIPLFHCMVTEWSDWGEEEAVGLVAGCYDRCTLSR